MAEQLPLAVNRKSLSDGRQQTQSRGHQALSCPKHLSSSGLLKLQREQDILMKSAKDFFCNFFDRFHPHRLGVLVCDASGVVLSAYGERTLLREMSQYRLDAGLVTQEEYSGNNVLDLALRHGTTVELWNSQHEQPCWAHWNWVASPIMVDDSQVMGACAVAMEDRVLLPVVRAVMEASCTAIACIAAAEEQRQDMARMNEALVSQLEDHFFFVHPGTGNIIVRHPAAVTPDTEEIMRKIVTSCDFVRGEQRIENHLYRIHVRQLTDLRGNYKGTLGLFHDISEQKSWETQLKDVERMATLNSLAAGIAHEIRNPLTAARGFLQLFSEKIENPDDRGFLDLTLRELDRINTLVKDFMSLAKPEAPNYTQTNFCEVVQNLVHFIQPEAALYGVPFEVTLPNTSLWIWGDENQLKQVLLNIVQNALQACRKVKGSVMIRLAQEQSRAVISIRDTGLGMDEAQLQHLFQPFYTTKDSGTGLGLTISRRIIEEHDGSISVQSSPGVGTTFTIGFDTISYEG